MSLIIYLIGANVKAALVLINMVMLSMFRHVIVIYKVLKSPKHAIYPPKESYILHIVKKIIILFKAKRDN